MPRRIEYSYSEGGVSLKFGFDEGPEAVKQKRAFVRLMQTATKELLHELPAEEPEENKQEDEPMPAPLAAEEETKNDE